MKAGLRGSLTRLLHTSLAPTTSAQKVRSVVLDGASLTPSPEST